MKRLAVHPWPGPKPSLQDGVFVIGIPTGPERDPARLQARQALAAALGYLLDLAPQDIHIESAPGAAPAALLPDGRRVHCSFTHDGGLSLAAVCFHGPVGVDVMEEEEVGGWEDVARDYLGPETLARLRDMARSERTAAFALAWTAREAHLKWLGVGLEEWPAHSQTSGSTMTLELPEGLVGTIVYGAAQE